MVRTATGTRPVASARIVKRNDNEVYVVTTVQHQEFVVRIHRAGESGLQDEAWALAAVRAVGVPVPDVLLVDRLVDRADRWHCTLWEGKRRKGVLSCGLEHGCQ